MATSITKDDNVIELTKEAFDELNAELENRKNVIRPQLAVEISEARDLGDLSENHAYASAMEKKDFNEDRIVELEDMLKNAKIVKTTANTNIVLIGSTVEIENIENNRKKVITIVGSEETQSADSREGKISTDSPIGLAVYKAKIGDTVEVSIGEKNVRYKINRFIKG